MTLGCDTCSRAHFCLFVLLFTNVKQMVHYVSCIQNIQVTVSSRVRNWLYTSVAYITYRLDMDESVARVID